MLGIEDYESASEGEDEKRVETPAKSKSQSCLPAVLPDPSKLKPSTSSSAIPPSAKTKRPKKITIGLPSLPSPESSDHDEPPAKKARTTGAGVSSLLSMLPAPKRADPAPQRVLGGKAGPGLVFSPPGSGPSPIAVNQDKPLVEGQTIEPPSNALVPPSITKGKANISLDNNTKATSRSTTTGEGPADFFSLGHVSITTSHAPLQSVATPATKFSAAPEVPTFEPPEPTPTDSYPGYYQLPSGAWAAYEPTYYAMFLKKWQDEYNAHVRALEKGTAKGFEGYDDSAVQDVDTQKEMEIAKIELKEREERKALTKGAGAGPSGPKMTMTASKMSGIAKTRHQLATLLRDAYQNREALEDKIAEGRRNRKEAGNKYGF